MKLSEYQVLSRETAIYPTLGAKIVYPALGLAGEAGEVVEKIKKLVRDTDGTITLKFQTDLAKELGDVLWYVAQVATEAGLTLEEVAIGNIEKLRDRQQRGVLQGGGDDR